MKTDYKISFIKSFAFKKLSVYIIAIPSLLSLLLYLYPIIVTKGRCHSVFHFIDKIFLNSDICADYYGDCNKTALADTYAVLYLYIFRLVIFSHIIKSIIDLYRYKIIYFNFWLLLSYIYFIYLTYVFFIVERFSILDANIIPSFS